MLDWDTDADGNVEYKYAAFYVEWQTVGRLVLDPKPYMPGRESQIRILGGTVTAPGDVAGTGFLQVWAYDQHKLPGFTSTSRPPSACAPTRSTSASSRSSRATRTSLPSTGWRVTRC